MPKKPKKHECPKCGASKTLREMRSHLQREHGYSPEEIEEAIALLKDLFKPTSAGVWTPRPATRAFDYDMQGRVSPILNLKKKPKKKKT